MSRTFPAFSRLEDAVSCELVVTCRLPGALLRRAGQRRCQPARPTFRAAGGLGRMLSPRPSGVTQVVLTWSEIPAQILAALEGQVLTALPQDPPPGAVPVSLQVGAIARALLAIAGDVSRRKQWLHAEISRIRGRNAGLPPNRQETCVWEHLGVTALEFAALEHPEAVLDLAAAPDLAPMPRQSQQCYSRVEDTGGGSMSMNRWESARTVLEAKHSLSHALAAAAFAVEMYFVPQITAAIPNGLRSHVNAVDCLLAKLPPPVANSSIANFYYIGGALQDRTPPPITGQMRPRFERELRNLLREQETARSAARVARGQPWSMVEHRDLDTLYERCRDALDQSFEVAQSVSALAEIPGYRANITPSKKRELESTFERWYETATELSNSPAAQNLFVLCYGRNSP